ncbi:MAG: nitroreductase, partial [Aliifodinibius sp.]|nr:nitroreductase [Fodinibius sp.]NIV09858.1 nitroreductase [Fodinibius sp.]NIY23401.1 nitroreductase [Fodinibius sp.]
IRNRRSIRGFIDKPVPKEVLHQIIDVALRAPSSMNTQSWEITIATGDVLEKIKEENVKEL